MKLTIERAALLRSLNHVQSVVERRNTIPILSNVHMEAAAGRLGLTATDMDLAAKTPEDMERLMDELKEDIQVGQTRNTNIFNISYESSDPQLAKRVVDALLNLFVERSLGEARKGSTATTECPRLASSTAFWPTPAPTSSTRAGRDGRKARNG